MKKYWKSLVLCIVTVFTLHACNKEEDPEPVPIKSSDLLGEWEITAFSINGQNRTADLSGYTFEIYFNGDFTVNKGTIDSYGSYEVNETTNTFTVSLSNPKEPAEVIDGTWQVYEKTASTLWLKSFGQEDTKEFRLTKI